MRKCCTDPDGRKSLSLCFLVPLCICWMLSRWLLPHNENWRYFYAIQALLPIEPSQIIETIISCSSFETMWSASATITWQFHSNQFIFNNNNSCEWSVLVWCLCGDLAVSFKKDTLTQPYYSPLSGRLPGWAGSRRNLLWDFMVQRKITGRHIDHPDGRHSIHTEQRPTTSIIPHFYAGWPSCCNPPTLSWLGTGIKYAGFRTKNDMV